MTMASLLRDLARGRLPPPGQAWLDGAIAEVAESSASAGALTDERFGALLSAASRHGRGRPLAPNAAERAAARTAVEGLELERWTLLETMRVALVLARRDLAQPAAVAAMESAFQYADEGELCALYRSLALWPEPRRFAARAGEGCRSNMRSVFEAVACDTPFPSKCFDELAFNQCVIKAIFIGAPLWRVFGLDARLNPELARMALDLAEERRSASRPVQPELWLAIGKHGGARGVQSLERELDPANTNQAGRRAAALALGRAGEATRIEAWLVKEKDAKVVEALRAAKSGNVAQAAFAALAA
jgi:hypothetical protein